MSFQKPDVVVVGAGLFGLTIAERCAQMLGLDVLIIEKRSHIGGNAYSEFDADSGIEVHKYGAHLFHTSNDRVWQYVNQFTHFTGYEHRVWGRYNGEVYPLPFTLALINQFYRMGLSPGGAREHVRQMVQLDSELFDSHNPANLEEKAISLLGYGMYNAFVKGYTAKQWQTDPRELSPDIITRLPVRYNYDTRYFTDKYQGQPRNGYAAWFNYMVDHPNIEVMLDTDWFSHRQDYTVSGNFPLVIYTGPLDRFFSYSEGRLPWRTVDFEYEHRLVDDYQGTSVINECDAHVPHTRTIEFKHLHPERDVPGGIHVHTPGRTVIAREFSRWAEAGDEPYYPIPGRKGSDLVNSYRLLTKREPNVLFGGRLGTYQYLDMHMAIASALTMFDNEIVPRFIGR
jgi:UDP-galactopyranose mutase